MPSGRRRRHWNLINSSVANRIEFYVNADDWSTDPISEEGDVSYSILSLPQQAAADAAISLVDASSNPQKFTVGMEDPTALEALKEAEVYHVSVVPQSPPDPERAEQEHDYPECDLEAECGTGATAKFDGIATVVT